MGTSTPWLMFNKFSTGLGRLVHSTDKTMQRLQEHKFRSEDIIEERSAVERVPSMKTVEESSLNEEQEKSRPPKPVVDVLYKSSNPKIVKSRSGRCNPYRKI